MKKRTFIIDCDTGTDDAIAVIAALYSSEIEVAAVTSVSGNVPHEYTSQNNLNLLEYLDMNHIRVARGATAPLYWKNTGCSTVHGVTGLGDIVLPTAVKSRFTEEYAPELIKKTAQELNGELELLVIGPMTNIAVALRLYPDLAGQIKHIWFMGGAVTGGNITATAEFNIWVDPAAAKLVLAAGIPCTMVGLDVTNQAVMGSRESLILREMGTKASVLAADLLDYMIARHVNGGEDALMHDALALAAALCPACLECYDYYVDVECSGEYTAGHTMVDLKNRLGRRPNVRVALNLDVKLFKQWLIDCIGNSLRS